VLDDTNLAAVYGFVALFVKKLVNREKSMFRDVALRVLTVRSTIKVIEKMEINTLIAICILTVAILRFGYDLYKGK